MTMFRMSLLLILLCLLSFPLFFQGKKHTHTSCALHSASEKVRATDEKYGTVVSSTPFKGGIRESVIIYPQQYHNSPEIFHRNGFLTRYKGARATVLICHGFMCDKYDVGILRTLFEPGQFNIMTFDFRGHGDNVHGQYCTLGRDEALDVIAAAQFLRKHKDLQGKPLFVYGFSMGAVASIEAQSLEAQLFDAMILDCPFDSSKKMIKHNLRHLKLSIFGYECGFPGIQLMQKYAFHPYVQLMIKTLLKTVSQFDANHIQTNICPSHPVKSAKKITVPCFFIHCKNDQKVSVEQVMAVYNSVSGYKRLWLTNGRRHFDSFFYDPEKYIEQIRSFCADILRKRHQKLDQAKIIEDQDTNEFVLSPTAV